MENASSISINDTNIINNFPFNIITLSRPEYCLFFFVVVPITIFVNAVLIYIFVKYRNDSDFNYSYYCLLAGLSVFNSIALITLTLRVMCLNFLMQYPFATNYAMWTGTCLGFYAGYNCQLLQAVHRLLAVVLHKKYETIFNRRRTILQVFAAALFSSTINLPFHIWHSLTVGTSVRFDNFDSKASKAWSIFDQIYTYSTCALLLIIYACTVTALVRKKKIIIPPDTTNTTDKDGRLRINDRDRRNLSCQEKQLSHKQRRNAGWKIGQKLTIHGILLTTVLIIGEVMFVCRPKDPFFWHFFLGLTIVVDPYFLLALQPRLRHRFFDVIGLTCCWKQGNEETVSSTTRTR